MQFTLKDLGCHIDSALGETHRRNVLAIWAVQFSRPDLAKLLADPPSCNFDEEEQVIQLMQENTSAGLHWVMAAGDLILQEDCNCDYCK